MAYKFKPNKSAAKRFKVTATGKLKRRHSKTSHLMSARTSKKKRMLGRPEVLFEGHARNMRRLMGIGGLHPAKTRHQRDLNSKGNDPCPVPQAAPRTAADASAS